MYRVRVLRTTPVYTQENENRQMTNDNIFFVFFLTLFLLSANIRVLQKLSMAAYVYILFIVQ